MEQEQLLQIINKIDNLTNQVDELKANIREVYTEARGLGFDTKAIREVLKLRKMDPADRAEISFLVEEYKKLLGL